VKPLAVGNSLTRLQALAEAFPRQDCPWEERPQFEPPVRDEALEAIRKAAGAALPDDFVAFLQECGGIRAMGVHNGYWIGGTEALTDGRFRYSFPTAVAGPQGTEAVFPVGTDGGGNAFLMTVHDGRVWRWDHETGHVRQVASSFSDFMERVVADWEHAIADDSTWEYLV
jgi:hypothetical protein